MSGGAGLYEKGSQEEKVYRFYRYGVEDFGEFHGGYLNFGYWTDGVVDYLDAAQRLVHRMGELLQLDEASRVLDVACGMGAQDVYLVSHFPLESIDALDLLPEHLVHARRRAEAAGLANIRFSSGTATALPFEPSSFSHVLCIEGLVHFDTRESFFRECHRVLKPQGRVAFSDYAVRREPRTRFEKLLLRWVTRLWNIPYANADSPEQYKRKLERSGFEQVIVHCVGERVIPGYCAEQGRPECIAELTRIRGFFAGRVGHVIDLVLEWAFRRGLIEYILVEGRKV